MGSLVLWIEKFDSAQQSRDLEMKLSAADLRIECNFPNDIGMDIRSTERGIAGIKLWPIRRSESCGQSYFARASGAATILLCSFQRHAQGDGSIHVVNDTELRITVPDHSNLKIGIKIESRKHIP